MGCTAEMWVRSRIPPCRFGWGYTSASGKPNIWYVNMDCTETTQPSYSPFDVRLFYYEFFLESFWLWTESGCGENLSIVGIIYEVR
uniref:Uncharacterized protein n=1 Tax=Zea mays TaxID=4577 RepID=A0A804LR80_MAIZE